MRVYHFLTFVLVFFLSNSYLNSQQLELYYGMYNWEEERERYTLSPGQEELPAVLLKNDIRYEYVSEQTNLMLYHTEHRIVRVNTDEAIQMNNKIYISMHDVVEIVNIKARSISPDGKVVELDEGNIKEIEDDETLGAVKIFAIEGAEKGSEIEYFYTRKIYGRFAGGEYFQYDMPTMNSSFVLVSPGHLVFKFKSYNGLSKVQDSTVDENNFYYMSQDSLPPLAKEEYAYYNPNRARLEFKLAYNTNVGRKEIFNWSQIASNQHKRIYELGKKEEKALDKWLKGLKLKTKATVEEKIKRVENSVKTSLQIHGGHREEHSQIDFILKNNFGDEFGMIRLLANAFKKLDIKHQIVITSGRDRMPLDPDFETYRVLNDYLFYFDETEAFMSPGRWDYRYPMIPPEFTHTFGLFIKTVKIGDYESSLDEVKFIPAPVYTSNFNNLDIKVAFNESLESVEISIDKFLGGYDATYIQPYYEQIEKEDRREMMEKIMQSYASDAEFKKLEVENTDPNISPVEKPLIIHAEMVSSALLEKAGDKILFKLGEIIGPQVEMYQDKERVCDVENDYNRMYDRKIVFEIPRGYQIKNLDDINIDLYHEKEGERVFNFTSSYTLDEGKVIVQIDEYYKDIECPLAYFEEYREVINAAADFNKVILVMEPAGE